MATYQDLLDQVALILGGTAPDAIGNPHFFSGSQVGDGTQLGAGTKSELKGAWSAWPETLQDSPFAICLPASFTISGPHVPEVPIAGNELNLDIIEIQLCVSHVDLRTESVILNVFRDTAPALFRSNQGLKGTSSVVNAWIRGGDRGVVSWAATEYIAWNFKLHVLRDLQVVYTT